MRLGKYLNGTSDIGLILSPDQLKGLECYIDADFAGDQYKTGGEISDQLRL